MAGTAIVRINEKEWQGDGAVSPSELQEGLGGLPGPHQGNGMVFDLAI